MGERMVFVGLCAVLLAAATAVNAQTSSPPTMTTTRTVTTLPVVSTIVPSSRPVPSSPYVTTICKPCTAEVCIAVCSLITTTITPTVATGPPPTVISTTIVNTTYPCRPYCPPGSSCSGTDKPAPICTGNFTGSWTATPVVNSVEVPNSIPCTASCPACPSGQACPCPSCPASIWTTFTDIPTPQWAVITATTRPACGTNTTRTTTVTMTAAPSSVTSAIPVVSPSNATSSNTCPLSTITTIVPYYSFVDSGRPTTTYVLPCGAIASCASNAECIYPLCTTSTSYTTRPALTASSNTTVTATPDGAMGRRSVMWDAL